jgi:hypothetical protein
VSVLREVFDAALKKGKRRGGKREGLRTIALYQKYLIMCVLGLLTANILSIVLSSTSGGRPPGGPVLGLVLLIALAALAAWIGGIVLGAMLANKVYNEVAAIFVGILSLIPCINLVTWLVVNGKATRLLRDKGIEVGFLGADLSDF